METLVGTRVLGDICFFGLSGGFVSFVVLSVSSSVNKNSVGQWRGFT